MDKVITTNTLLYYHNGIKELLSKKVESLDGYSLMSDDEILRLSSVVNYDDSTVQSAITTMQGQITALEEDTYTYDDTQLKNDIAATYATIVSLSAHTGDSVVHITSTERTKWNAKLDSSAISSWAKSSTKPSYTASEVGADESGSAATALTVAKSYTDSSVSALETSINNKLTSAMHYKGSVNTYAELPTDAELGDFYNIKTADNANGVKAGDNAAWNGTEWDITAGTIDLSDYYSINDIATDADIDAILNS